MILHDYEIIRLCKTGMVQPFNEDLVNGASLDVRLGGELLIESAQSPEMIPYPLLKHDKKNPYELVPGQFALAPTIEMFRLPNDVAAQFVLKSSLARSGLQHLLAGWCDPGWHGSVLTMELKNARQIWPVKLWPGMRIGQMVFKRMLAAPTLSYDLTGRYNNDKTVKGSRGV